MVNKDRVFSSLYLYRASLMAGTAQRRRTKPKGGMTPCWDVSHQNPFYHVLKKIENIVETLYFSISLLFYCYLLQMTATESSSTHSWETQTQTTLTLTTLM